MKIWDNVKAWFKKSETIFLARLEIFTGFIVGVIGAVDWIGFANSDILGLSKNQLLLLSAMFILKGIIAEYSRRRNTVTIDNQLIPTNLVK